MQIMEQLNNRRWPVKRVDIAINMEATGENIRRLVKANGYTVEEIREILGLGSKQAVYKWFRGESIPGPENQIILCKMFEIEITELLVIDGEFALYRRFNHRLNDWVEGLKYNYVEGKVGAKDQWHSTNMKSINARIVSTSFW